MIDAIASTMITGIMIAARIGKWKLLVLLGGRVGKAEFLLLVVGRCVEVRVGWEVPNLVVENDDCPGLSSLASTSGLRFTVSQIVKK